MAINETFFEYADKGATSVFKFRMADDLSRQFYVLLDYGEGNMQLYKTSVAGPYNVADPLEETEYRDFDHLLEAHDTTEFQWKRDLMAQFGERLAWSYP